MTAARKNLLVDLGTTFRLPVLYRDSDGNPVDLTGATVFFNIYKPGDRGTLYYSQPIDGPADGQFTVEIPDEETSQWSWGKGAYALDVHETDGNWTGLLWGSLTVRDRADV